MQHANHHANVCTSTCVLIMDCYSLVLSSLDIRARKYNCDLAIVHSQYCGIHQKSTSTSDLITESFRRGAYEQNVLSADIRVQSPSSTFFSVRKQKSPECFSGISHKWNSWSMFPPCEDCGICTYVHVRAHQCAKYGQERVLRSNNAVRSNVGEKRGCLEKEKKRNKDGNPSVNFQVPM